MEKAILIAKHRRCFKNEDPRIEKLDEYLKEKRLKGRTISGLFAQRNYDLSPGDIAEQLMKMEYERVFTPYQRELDF